jgi:hypothetical protein
MGEEKHDTFSVGTCERAQILKTTKDSLTRTKMEVVNLVNLFDSLVETGSKEAIRDAALVQYLFIAVKNAQRILTILHKEPRGVISVSKNK